MAKQICQKVQHINKGHQMWKMAFLFPLNIIVMLYSDSEQYNEEMYTNYDNSASTAAE